MSVKKISISIPCRNEEENIEPLVASIEEQFARYLPDYDYEIQFSDNASTDSTRDILREICAEKPHVRAIFNVVSCTGSAFNSIFAVSGDCCVHMAADFQDPPDLIPKLVKEWEQGAKIVCAIKTSSEENKLLWKTRTLYYKIIQRFSPIRQIEHFTGFGLYDRDFIEIMKGLQDPAPTLRGVVAEYGYKVKQVPFAQPRRKGGKTSQSFFSLFDYAMRNFTTYTRAGLRMATFLGMLVGFLSFVVGIVYFVLKLLFWNSFPAGTAPILIGMFFLGAVQLFFIGMIGEYILALNRRVMNRPLAVEEERIGFPTENPDKDKP